MLGIREGAGRLSIMHPFFISPEKDTNSPLPRAAAVACGAPSCRPSARGRHRGPVAMRNVLHGRHVGVEPVSRLPSMLVSLPWVAAQPRHLCSWCSSCLPLWTGLPLTRWPNTAAPHRPAAPDRRDASPFDRRRCGRP